MDYTQMQREFSGEYVALLKGKVIAHGKTFGSVLDKVKKLGIFEDINLSFRYIHPRNGICVYSAIAGKDEEKNFECNDYGIKQLKIFNANVVVPEIPLLIKTKFGFRREWFLVDTGADVTSFPKSAIELFDNKVEKTNEKIYGFEGIGIKVSKSSINMKICNKEVKVRCIFSDRDNIPFLLGRVDIFDKFNIMFYKDKLCFAKRKNESI